jgi:hypothetical protein
MLACARRAGITAGMGISLRARLLGLSILAATSAGCSNKESETAGGGQETTAGDPSGDPGGDPTGDPGGDPTDDPTGSTGSQRICELYLNCLAVIAPTELPAAQQGFGPEGTCWQGSQASADQCLMACATGLTDWHEIYPDEAACGLCQAEDDCKDGTVCQGGECGAPLPENCGDGKLDADEVCDDPICDEDCLGPAVCNPLNQVGCAEGEACLYLYPDVFCGPDEPGLPQLGETCGPATICVAGTLCVPASNFSNCDGEGCCAAFCDRGDSGDCPGTCADGEGFIEPSLDRQVGFCAGF